MALRCIAIDDEPPALQLLSMYCSRMPQLQLAATFEDAVAAKAFLRHTSTDLLFVDINMPDINGLDLVKELMPRPMVIFTTAYKKFAWEGFELQAIDYLLKPFAFERFETAVTKALEYHRFLNTQTSELPSSIYVRSEYKLVRIELDAISYVEALEDYIKIHLDEARPVMTLMSMKAFADLLPAKMFVRIHRSYIIPVNKIVAIQSGAIKLPQITLPVGKSYQAQVAALLQ